MLQICLHPHTNILIQRQKVNDPENVQRPSYLRNVHACVPQKPEICVWINKQFTCFKAFRTPTLCLNRAHRDRCMLSGHKSFFSNIIISSLNMTVNALATVIVSLNPHQRPGRGPSLACGSDLILTLNHFMKPASPELARQPPGWVHLENNKFLWSRVTISIFKSDGRGLNTTDCCEKSAHCQVLHIFMDTWSGGEWPGAGTLLLRCYNPWSHNRPWEHTTRRCEYAQTREKHRKTAAIFYRVMLMSIL